MLGSTPKRPLRAWWRVARGSKVPAAARVAAWNAVLDRGHGRPPQALAGADGADLIPRLVTHVHETIVAAPQRAEIIDNLGVGHPPAAHESRNL